ncbi:MAG: hypothetical protein JNJ99_07535 [Crocinitomicaceae bacterium]|nr:hypothetical protein [Crocinitomicaceae bacterium]
MSRNITLILIAVVFGFVQSSLQGKIEKYHHSDSIEKLNSSANPPAAKTGAPGESNCTSCHSGTTQSGAGNITLDFSGVGSEYVVGQSYTFTISIASGTKNGFEATILDATNVKAGTFTAGTNYGITNASGRQYVRQTVSDGITSWTFNWTAPSSDMGDLTLYYAFNKSNNSDNSSGDIIYLGQMTISSATFNTITSIEQANEQLNIVFNSLNNELHLDFYQQRDAPVILQLIDMNGKLLYNENIGILSEGKNHIMRSIPSEFDHGIYIFSLIVGNEVYDRKIYL